jgi:DNA-binding LacI/PurR family transcriptional regulator
MTDKLTAVHSEPGRPLYESVTARLRQAIAEGHFKPGDRMPSTKQLSVEMHVSLVTAHRALQDLRELGLLERVRGKGTFVRSGDPPGGRVASKEVGLVLHRNASLADFFHSQVSEGICNAGTDLSVKLQICHFGDAVSKGCDRYLFLNPLPGELDMLQQHISPDVPLIAVGARSDRPNVCSIDVDNQELAARAVDHLVELGHRHIGFIGGPTEVGHNRDRLTGFRKRCEQLGVPCNERSMLIAESFRLSENEAVRLGRMLNPADRPTALFASGYYLALDVYTAAGSLGLSIPRDLSVVGVDDPPSAQHLSPPLTTLRQPLVQLGYTALDALMKMTPGQGPPPEPRPLSGQLIIRNSSAALHSG